MWYVRACVYCVLHCDNYSCVAVLQVTLNVQADGAWFVHNAAPDQSHGSAAADGDADGDAGAAVLLTDESAVGARERAHAAHDVIDEWGQVQAIGRAVEEAMTAHVGGWEQGQRAERTRCCGIMRCC